MIARPRLLLPTRYGRVKRRHADEHASQRRDGAGYGDRSRHAQRRVRALLAVRTRGPAPGTWRYNLNDGKDARAATGRVAGMTDHMDVLRYAAGVCAAGYQPGTIQRGMLEQFAVGGTAHQDETQ